MSQETIQANLLLKAVSAMKSDQVAHGFIHLCPEYPQGWRLLNLSGQPDPPPGCSMLNFFLTRNKSFLNCVNNAGFDICGDSM